MLLSNERLKQIFSILTEDKKKMFFMIILTFIISFLDILGIGLIGQFIGLILNLDKLEGLNLSFNFYDYLKRFDRDKVIILSSVGLFFIFLFKNIISVFIRWVIIKFTFEKKIFLQKKLLDYYLSLKLVDFTSKNTSELTETVYELSQTFVTALESFLRILSEAIMLIMIIIFLSIISFKVVMTTLIIFTISFFILDLLYKKKLISIGKELSFSSKKIFAFVSELFKGYKEIKILDKQKFFKDRILDSSAIHAEKSIIMAVVKSLPRYVLEVLIVASLVIFFSVSFLSSGTIITSLPILGVFVAATIRMVPSIGAIIGSITIFRFCEYAIEKIFNELKNKDNFNLDNYKKNKLKIKFEKFEIKNLTFKYPKKEKNVFENLEFSFQKGETIGIIGDSGSGKTTLINIILGLISVDNEFLRLNGAKLENNLYSWQNIISYIPQEAFIIDDTVEENITLNDDESRKEHLAEILKISNLKNTIENQSLNLSTLVGENGVKISGGQKQRIAIARALYRNRQIIILDEPTSSLDVESEKQIIKTIENLKKNHTLLISSHKSSIIDVCDKVYEVKNNQLINKI
jgi:ATP-binding cassette, subfamily B, bacterial PglK